MKRLKEVVIPGTGSVRYSGDAAVGLAIKLGAGEILALTPAQIEEVFERFSGRNLLLDNVEDVQSGLQRFSAWAVNDASGFFGRVMAEADAQRVLAVFMGEGLLGLENEQDGPVPDDFPRGAPGRCLEEMQGRVCVLEVQRQMAHVLLRRVSIEGGEDPDAAHVTLDLEVIDSPGFGWRGPERFHVGSYAGGIGVSAGYAASGMAGWMLLTGPRLVTAVVQAAAAQPGRIALLREMRRLVNHRYCFDAKV